MSHTFFIKHFCGQTFNICSTSHSSSPKGWGRGWDVLCSRCLWLPSNRKPIEVDILNCQNGLPAEMELISSYLRRKRNQPCAQPCPRAAESDPFPEPSHATVKILEATKEFETGSFTAGSAWSPWIFSSSCHLGLWGWLWNGVLGCCQSIWAPFKADGWNLRCAQASPRNWTDLPFRSPAGRSQTWEPGPVIAVSIPTVPVSSARSSKRVLPGVAALQWSAPRIWKTPPF